MNIYKILNKFPESMKVGFEDISKKLEIEEFPDKELEYKLAVLILDFMEETNLDEYSIMRTSYLIANAFKEYSFDEKIKKSIEIFCEIQIPSSFQDGTEFEKWDKAKKYLLEFLDNSENK